MVAEVRAEVATAAATGVVVVVPDQGGTVVSRAAATPATLLPATLEVTAAATN
jgi:hypothetical protein